MHHAPDPAEPVSLEALGQLISERFDSLAPRLQAAARYLIDHPNAAGVETIKALSSAAGIQPSVLVRLAQALGYSGFSGMQAVFRAALLAQTQSYGERMRAQRKSRRQTPAGGAGEMLRRLCEGSIESLQGLRDATDASALEAAVSLLAGARNIQVLGLRRAWPIATYLVYLLSRSERAAGLLGGMGGMLGEEVRALGPGDVLVAISFQPFHVDTVAAAQQACARGAAVLALTDSALSPLARGASVVLQVRDADIDGFRSVAASMVLCHGLVVGLALAEAPLPLARPGRRGKIKESLHNPRRDGVADR